MRSPRSGAAANARKHPPAPALPRSAGDDQAVGEPQDRERHFVDRDDVAPGGVGGTVVGIVGRGLDVVQVDAVAEEPGAAGQQQHVAGLRVRAADRAAARHHAVTGWLLALQRAAVQAEPCPIASVRRAWLLALTQQTPRYQDLVAVVGEELAGKSVDCGQICIAPDHPLVQRERQDTFVAAAQRGFQRLYGRQTEGRPHQRRQRAPAAASARRVGRRARQGRDGYRPRDAAERGELPRRAHSGGGTHNDWGWHAVNLDAPFGGIGNSGTGNCHGEEGFREPSHARTAFERQRRFPTWLFHAPFGNSVQKRATKFFLGKAGPTLGCPAGHRASALPSLRYSRTCIQSTDTEGVRR